MLATGLLQGVSREVAGASEPRKRGASEMILVRNGCVAAVRGPPFLSHGIVDVNRYNSASLEPLKLRIWHTLRC